MGDSTEWTANCGLHRLRERCNLGRGQFGDFDVTAVMDLLRTRGRLLIKRAYGDWGRFHRYRRAMLENGIDLFQLYSVGIQQKNRADVRLAIDAMETVFTRPNIDVYAIVSGDSDFTELIHKLRDYGKYTIGIGLHSATSDLLRRACDEFIFYETLVAEELSTTSPTSCSCPTRAICCAAHSMAAEQKGETPVFAGRLKQIMLSLDSSFNEANYGYQQFRAFLEGQLNLITLQEIDSQLYVKLRKAGDPPASPASLAESSAPSIAKPISEVDPSQRFRSFLREAGLRVIDYATRRQVLADFLSAVQSSLESLSLNQAADLLKDRYDAENALTQKIAVGEVMRLLIMSGALRYQGNQPASDAQLLETQLLTLDSLSPGCDSVYVTRLVEGGVPVDAEALAPLLYGSGASAGQVMTLCERLTASGCLVLTDGGCTIAPARDRRISCPRGVVAGSGQPEACDVARRRAVGRHGREPFPRGVGPATEGLRRQRAALSAGGTHPTRCSTRRPTARRL